MMFFFLFSGETSYSTLFDVNRPLFIHNFPIKKGTPLLVSLDILSHTNEIDYFVIFFVKKSYNGYKNYSYKNYLKNIINDFIRIRIVVWKNLIGKMREKPSKIKA